MTWRPWHRAWHEALYAPRGFYRRPEGPAGHFATSAQGIPGVGALLAQAVTRLAAQHDLRTIVDVGAGRGELLRELHRVDPDLHLTGLDVVDRPRGLPSSIEWVVSPGGADLPEVRFEGALVLAHEWLDVVPAPIAEVDADGELRLVEVCVDQTTDPGGPVIERLGAISLDPAWQEWISRHWTATEPGERVEIGLPRDRAWESLCDKASHGLVVAVDYGHTAQDRPPFGTLTGFRLGTEVPPVADGTCDLTAHVAVDSLVADRRIRQHDLLRELDLIPPNPDVRLASSDPPAYLARLAARGAAVHAGAQPGLGDFWWMLRAV